MRTYKSLIIGLVVCAFPILTTAEVTASGKQDKQAQPIVSLKTIKVEKEEVQLIQVLNGQIEAVNKSTVSAQTEGTIEELNYDVGDFVEKGSVIARIKSLSQKAGLKQAEASVGQARAAVAEAQAAYRAALASAEEASANFKRIESIYSRKLVSRAEYDKAKAAKKTAIAQASAAKAALASAKAAVAAAQAKKTQAGEQLEYTSVIAPYSGLVVDRHVELGEVVGPGKPIMTGISLEQLRVTTEVPQGLIKDVRKYHQASVYVLGDKPPIAVKSLVFFPYADPLTNAFKVRAELESGLDGLYPGVFVKVAFVVGEEKQLVIPESAVAYRGEVTGVYLIDKGMPILQQVRLGKKLDNGKIRVLSGLREGDVITSDPIEATLFVKQKRLTTENTHE